MSYITDLGKRAKAASLELSNMSQLKKNELLLKIADALTANCDMIISANRVDIQKARENGMSEVMTDRLRLDEGRISAIADAVKKVSAMQDPIGEVLEGKTLANGLRVIKKRVPLGVVGIIYESRPNVTVDAAVLCLKSSNVAVLRGGSDAISSNIALCRVMRDTIRSMGINPDVVQLIEDTSREVSTQMMRLNGFIDVLIPRGGAGLIKAVIENATVPVIETGTGNCHVYVDESADLDMAASIVYNAKTSRPSVCNACESLLVHEAVAESALPKIKKELERKNVIMLGCDRTISILGGDVQKATDEDFATEFLDYKISVLVVKDIHEAIGHINKYTTHHSEVIVTRSFENANLFTEQVDAAAVYVNASSRFTDGEMFGMGAEIGISTQKLHVRGPMGLRELTSMKYIITGDGQIR